MYVTSPNNFFDASPIHAQAVQQNGVDGTSTVKVLAAGTNLFCEGDKSDHVYEVLEGVLRSSKVLFDGRRQIISFGYPGDILGISHDSLYHSDCEAISEVKVRVHHRNASTADYERAPEFFNLILKHAAAEMNNMQEHFMMLGRKSALEKVASFMVVLMERVGKTDGQITRFDLPMSRSDIADFLGLTIETVSRTVTILRKKGVIELPKPHEIAVLKSAGLRSLAEQDEQF